jgi:hypothetical protein
VRAQRIDRLCALAHEQVSYAVLHEQCLLLGRLRRHSTDRRSTDGLTARRRIDRIVLVALDVGLHVLGRHQPYVMAELLQLTRPVVGRRTRFHADETRREFGKEGQHLRSSQRLVENHLVVDVDAMHLEHVFGKINADRDNLHVDGPLNVIRL